MRIEGRGITLLALLAALLALTIPAASLPTGIGGDQTAAGGPDNVAKQGCTCHGANPSNSITVILDNVPMSYLADQTYALRLQIIGGPDPAAGNGNTGGFSMLVDAGALAATPGDEELMANVGDDPLTLTHTLEGATTEQRSWSFSWTAPVTGSGIVTFWISANSVDGAGGNQGDMWNRLIFSLPEGDQDSSLATRTIFAGDGDVQPQSSAEGHVELHEMGAAFRAHWLGLLGFGAVIIVILFCGLMMRYGFSHSYHGRSNLLKLRYLHMRRGDQ